MVLKLLRTMFLSFIKGISDDDSNVELYREEGEDTSSLPCYDREGGSHQPEARGEGQLYEICCSAEKH